MSDLLRQLNTNGGRVSRREQRAMMELALQVRGEVQIAGLKADGHVALAGHIMEGLADLDATRKQLSSDDPGLNQMLVEVEVAAFRGTRRIQNGLFSDWGL